jgi:hypothetical protein
MKNINAEINFTEIKTDTWLYLNTQHLREIKEILISKNETDIMDLGRKYVNKIAEILLRDEHQLWVGCITGDNYAIDHNYPSGVMCDYEDHIDRIRLDGYGSEITLQYLNKLIAFSEIENAIPVKLLNYTPHTINLGDIAIFSNGNARVSEKITVIDTLSNIDLINTDLGEVVDTINNIDIINKKLGEVTGLPEQKDKQFIIVSLMVAQALPEREDLLIPGELVRDNTGKIIGCKNLCKL